MRFKLMTPRRQRAEDAVEVLIARHAEVSDLMAARGVTEADWYRAEGALGAIEDAIDLLNGVVVPCPAPAVAGGQVVPL